MTNSFHRAQTPKYTKSANSTLKFIEKSCGRYLEAYANCIEKYPDTHHIDCNTQASKLQRCSNSHPTISKIKTECSTEFDVYSSCVDRHPQGSERVCSNEFKKFTSCADDVTQKLEI